MKLVNPKLSEIQNSFLINLENYISEENNSLIFENKNFLPYKIKRLYYLYEISGHERGTHAHKSCHRFIIPVSGNFSVEVNDGKKNKIYDMKGFQFGLFIHSGLWSRLSNFSENSIILILASELYDPLDYIRDYHEFLNFKK